MKKFKKLLLLICVLTCLVAMTACGGKKEEKEKFSEAYSESDLINVIVENTEAVVDYSNAEIDEVIEEYDEDAEIDAVLISGLEQLKNAKKESGKYEGFYFDDNNEIEYELTETKDSITITARAKFEKRDVIIEYSFGYIDDTFSITEMKYEPVYTLGEKMKTAALNTLMGMGVVIVVLAFLSVFISLFKYINLLEKKFKERKNNKNESPMDSTFEQIESKEEIAEECDDLEVVAVITAAIAAMEQTTTDGFVVRSIKRVPGKKWNRGI